MHPHALKLQKAGYKITVHSEYHFSVQRPGNLAIINVWPTARKILRKWSPGPAPHYTDILDAVARAFIGESQTIFVVEMYDMDTPEWQEIFKYRKDPLKYLRSIIESRV